MRIQANRLLDNSFYHSEKSKRVSVHMKLEHNQTGMFSNGNDQNNVQNSLEV